MTEKERLIKELENYEPYAARFPHLTIDGGLILDVLRFLRGTPGIVRCKEQLEIVRCKECKYWQPNTEFCKRWTTGFIAHHTPPEWFCADGKVKRE